MNEVRDKWLLQFPLYIQNESKSQLKDKKRELENKLFAYLTLDLKPGNLSLLAKAFTALYLCDSLGFGQTVGRCCDLLKAKEDANSSNTRRNVLSVLGGLYSSCGQAGGAMLIDVVQTLSKLLRFSECRVDVLDCLRSVTQSLGSSVSSCQKEILKLLKNCLSDKSVDVRRAAAECSKQFTQACPTAFIQDMDSVLGLCLKASEGSNQVLRAGLAHFMGDLLIASLQPPPPHLKAKHKQLSLQDSLSLLSSAAAKRGGAGMGGEGRVVVMLAYLVFLRGMGGKWLGRNTPTVLQHLLDLRAAPRALGTHVTAVLTRNGVLFVLNEAFGCMLREASQVHVAKVACTLAKHCLQQGQQGQPPAGEAAPAEATQHQLVCLFLFLSRLVVRLNTAALPLLTSDGSPLSASLANRGLLLEVVASGLGHGSPDVRLAAAWSVRALGATLHTELALLLDGFVAMLKAAVAQSPQSAAATADAVGGCCAAVAALMACARDSQLGLPANKTAVVLGIASELLKSDNGPTVLSAWTLVAGCCCVGAALLQPHLSMLLLMYKEAFPKSMKELNVEQSQFSPDRMGNFCDSRAGALASIQCLVKHCPELVDERVLRRVLISVNSTLAMLGSLSTSTKPLSAEVKGKLALLRLRLYNTLHCLPPASYEGCLSGVLRELVGELTLTTNLTTTFSSLMSEVCDVQFSLFVDLNPTDTDYHLLERQLLPFSASGAEALEHDALFLLEQPHDSFPPGALPLGVAVIDAAILLFGRVFPQVSLKHRAQLLTHFLTTYKSVKAQKLPALQINVFLALILSLKNLSAGKDHIGDRSVSDTCTSLIQLSLASSNQLVRCLGAEALGHLVVVLPGEHHVSSLLQSSLAVLQTTRDVHLRSGHSLALGCLHRFLGTLGSKNHINATVAMVTALAKDGTSSLCQIWALYALVLVVESGGPMFRSHTEPTLQLVHQLLVTTPLSVVGVHCCLGLCLNSLITALGPELQDSSPSLSAVRGTCVSCTHLLLEHPAGPVRASGLLCLQQLQLYASSHLAVRETVRLVVRSRDPASLLLRRAVANCLRQFSQLDPPTTRGAASEVLGRALEEHAVQSLDRERDGRVRGDLQELLYSLLTSLAPRDPMHWLGFCNKLLSAGETPAPRGDTAGEAPKAMEDDEVGALTVSGDDDQGKATPLHWQTRLFAMELVRKVYNSCRSDPAHFDHQLAVSRQQSSGGDYLVLHLPELVKTSFLAATSDVLQLRITGYESLKDIISLFGSTPDPDFPEHGLLELYQAQIGAALRPAFSPDTPPHITAIACQVCSQWLVCGVSGDVGDLSRVQQLLVSSLQKLERAPPPAPPPQEAEQPPPSRRTQYGEAVATLEGLAPPPAPPPSRRTQYGEAVATLESLAVLRAWAELYIKISSSATSDQQGKGVGSIEDHLPLLAASWLAGVEDYALLTLPSHLHHQLPSQGAFFSMVTADSVRPYYQDCWYVLLHAAILWEGQNGALSKPSAAPPTTGALFSQPLVSGDRSSETFSLLLGLVVRALCDSVVLERDSVVLSLLTSLHHLVSTVWAGGHLVRVPKVAVEISGVLHRVLLTTRSTEIHRSVVATAHTISTALCKEGGAEGVVEAVMRIPSFVVVGFVFGKCSTYVDSKASRETVTMAIKLLIAVVKLTLPPDVLSNTTCVLYILLSALSTPTFAIPSDGPPLTPTLIQAIDSCLSTVGSGPSAECLLELVTSSMSSVFEGDPSSPVDISEMPARLKLPVLARLLLALQPAPPLTAPPFSTSIDYIASRMEDSSDVAVQQEAIRCAVRLLTAVEEPVLVAKLTPPLLEFAIASFKPGTPASARPEGWCEVVQAVLAGLEEVCVNKGKDETLCEFFLSLLLSLLPEQPPSDKISKELHQSLVSRLKELGPKHINVMKKVIADPAKKARLEAALKASAPSAHNVRKSQLAAKTAQPKAPTITLRQDFSNFKLK